MGGKKALCSVLAGLVALAAMPACEPSLLEGYVVARVSGIAVPDYDVSQSELEAHPGAVPFRIGNYGDTTLILDGPKLIRRDSEEQRSVGTDSERGLN